MKSFSEFVEEIANTTANVEGMRTEPLVRKKSQVLYIRRNMKKAKNVHDMSVDEASDPCWDGYRQLGMKKKGRKKVPNCVPVSENVAFILHTFKHSLQEASPAWQRKEGKSETGGLNRKGIESYRRANKGSKLSMAVTTDPSKLEPDSKSAKRRKSFCARMKGMKKRLTSKETADDPDSRINKSLRKWNC
jgi:hypothetical protein